jgi:hypothetical protein
MPEPVPLDAESILQIAKMVIPRCKLARPEVVQSFIKTRSAGCFHPAVFRSKRSRRGNPYKQRLAVDEDEGSMYDDNTSPRWALLWAHGITNERNRDGSPWVFAHVWEGGAAVQRYSDDIRCYTRLENLAMVPRGYSNLTDEGGPLAVYLRYHAWDKYRWKPEDEKKDPSKPFGYDDLEFKETNYFDLIEDPEPFVCKELKRRALNSERARILLKLWRGNKCD